MKRFIRVLGMVGLLASVCAFLAGVLLLLHPMAGGLESIPPHGLSYERKTELRVYCLFGFVSLALVGLFYLGLSFILLLFSKQKSL
jgi:hypothetical protein